MKINKNKFKHGAYAILAAIMVVSVIILLNVFVSILSGKVDLQFDLTTDKNNSLSEENIDIIKGFNKNIQITVLSDEDTFLSNDFLAENYHIYDGSDGNYAVQAKNLLREYQKNNSKIKVKYIDSTSPDYAGFVSKYSTETLSPGDILVESDDSLKIISVNDLFSLSKLEYYVGYSIEGSNMEAALTSAIITVTGTGPVKAQIVTAHSADKSVDFETLLEGNNFSVSTIDSLEFSDIREETRLLVINSPTSDFSKNEIAKLKEFLTKEDNLLIYVSDSTQPKLPLLEAFLEGWGIIPMDGVILETDSERYYNDNYLTFFNYLGEEYEELAGKGLYCLTYAHRPFKLVDDEEGYFTKALLEVPSTALLYPTDTKLQDSFVADKAERGPFYGAILAEKTLDDGKSSILSIGSKNFLVSEVMTSGAYGNANFMMQTIGTALNFEDTSVYFAPKEINTRSGLVDASTANLIGTWLFMVILPASVLLIGLYNWMKRSSR